MKLRQILILLIGLASFSPDLLAQHADSVVQMEHVTVTATRRPTLIKRLPYSVEVLKRNAIDNQLSRTVPEALQGTPGVFIQKTNHAGGSPFLRGLTGNQSLILVDGIRLNNSIFRYGPNQYMTLVDPLIVDRIEVVKGTGSVQYGSDAMTGVINIMTRELSFSDKNKWTESIQSRVTETGMETTWRPEISYQGKRIAFSIGADTKNFGNLKGGDTTGFQVPSGYNEKAFDAKLKLDLGKNWIVTLANQWLEQQDVPVYHKYKLENFAVNTSDPISRGFSYTKIKKTYSRGIVNELNFFGARQFIKETRYSQKKGSPTTRYERDAIETLSFGGEVNTQFSKYWDANSGIELYRDEVRSFRNDYVNTRMDVANKRGLYPDNSSYTNLAIYSIHHLQFNKLTIEAGARFNQYNASIKDQTLGKIAIKPGALVFQGGLNYQLNKKLFVYANMSEGFRAPNIDDLGTLGIVDFRYEQPAYNLEPERSLNVETGIKYVGKKTAFSGSIFRTNLSGLITRIKTGEVISGYDVYTKVNVDKGFVKGWEAQGQVKLLKGLSLQASATSLFGESVTKAQPLRRIPPFNSRIALEYRNKRFSSGLNFDHASPQRRLEAGDKSDNRIPTGGTPGFNVLNSYLSYETSNVITRLYVSNILNTDYRTHGSGINGMGRAVSLTTIIQFNQFK